MKKEKDIKEAKKVFEDYVNGLPEEEKLIFVLYAIQELMPKRFLMKFILEEKE